MLKHFVNQLKIFCSEQFEITLLVILLLWTRLHKTKIADNKDNTYFLTITYKLKPSSRSPEIEQINTVAMENRGVSKNSAKLLKCKQNYTGPIQNHYSRPLTSVSVSLPKWDRWLWSVTLNIQFNSIDDHSTKSRTAGGWVNINDRTEKMNNDWFEFIPQFELYVRCPLNRNNALLSTFISMWDLHCGICLPSFWNWDFKLVIQKGACALIFSKYLLSFFVEIKKYAHQVQAKMHNSIF